MVRIQSTAVSRLARVMLLALASAVSAGNDHGAPCFMGRGSIERQSALIGRFDGATICKPSQWGTRDSGESAFHSARCRILPIYGHTSRRKATISDPGTIPSLLYGSNWPIFWLAATSAVLTEGNPMDTIYREPIGRNRWQYWTYSDGARVILSERRARLMLRQRARLVTVD